MPKLLEQELALTLPVLNPLDCNLLLLDLDLFLDGVELLQLHLLLVVQLGHALHVDVFNFSSQRRHVHAFVFVVRALRFESRTLKGLLLRAAHLTLCCIDFSQLARTALAFLAQARLFFWFLFRELNLVQAQRHLDGDRLASQTEVGSLLLFNEEGSATEGGVSPIRLFSFSVQDSCGHVGRHTVVLVRYLYNDFWGFFY